MSISEKLTTIAENVTNVYNAGYEKGKAEGGGGDVTDRYDEGFADGKQAEHDAFWDSFQRNGSLSDYSYSFTRWQESIFKPKYNVYPVNGSYMFNNFNNGNTPYTDLIKLFNGLDAKLDTSRCTNFNYMFYFAWINTVPTLDTRKASDLTKMFNSSTRVVTIEKIILKDDGSQTLYTGSSDNCFYNCSSLVNVTFEGVIGNNIGFRNSTKLSTKSMASAMEHLSQEASSKTIYFNQTAVNNAVFPITSPTYPEVRYESWEDLVAKTKPSGWTVIIVP